MILADSEGIVNRVSAPAFFLFFGLAGAALFPTTVGAGEIQARVEKEKPRPADSLRQIYAEVKELGPYPGESFIKHEFFLGPADDDTYKKEHIVVLIQADDGVEKMKIQVTEMETRPDNPRIQLAGRVRSIVCAIAGDDLTIVRSDYVAKEVDRLAPDILRAVREKKKLLKSLGPATCAESFFGHNRGAVAAVMIL
jgi:hypothetical protein